MGLSSASEAKETALVEPWLDVGEKLTEFFVTDEIEACARRTGLVRRTSTITGKVFLALGTLGAWAPPKTSVAQRTVKGARLPTPGAVWPEALPQRLTRRAVAFLRALLQRAVVKLQMGDTVGDAELWEPVTAVHHVESTGVEGPPSLQAFFPGSSGEASTAGAKILLVWEYRSPSFAPLALVAGTTPDNPYIDTGVKFAQRGALWRFALGSLKGQALALMARAAASLRTRLNPQTALDDAVGGRWPRGELAHVRKRAPGPVLENARFPGARNGSRGGALPRARPKRSATNGGAKPARRPKTAAPYRFRPLSRSGSGPSL